MSGYERLLGGFSSTRQAIADASDPSSLFKEATWDQVGKNKELTEFIQRSMDPDGSKYGGDIEALKTDMLNTVTTRGSSAVLSIWDAIKARGENVEKKRFENLVGRLYEDAPNRLVSGNLNDTYQAVKSGLIGGVGYDLPLNILLAPASLARLGISKIGEAGLRQAGKEILQREGVQTAITEAAAGRVGSQELLTKAAEEASQAATSAAWRIGAKQEAISGGVAGALGDVAQQDAEQQRGLRSEFSLTDLATNAAGGAGIGAFFGAAGGKFLDGKRLGRELTNGAPGFESRVIPEKGSLMGEGDTIMGRVRQGEAAFGPQMPDGYVPTLTPRPDAPSQFLSSPEAYAEYNTKLKDFAGDIDEFQRLVATGKIKSAYTADQIAVMRTALDRLVNPVEMAESERKTAAALRQGGDPKSLIEANAAELRARSYERFADYVTRNEFGVGDFFSEGGDLRPEVRDALVQFDPAVAEAFTPKRQAAGGGTTPPPAAGGAQAAGSGGPVPPAPPAPPPAGGQAAAAPTAPTAASAEQSAPAAGVEPGQTASQAVANTVSAPAGAPTASDITTLAEAGFSPDEKVALNDLTGLLAKASMDMDGMLAAIATVGQNQAITDVAKAAGANRGTVKDAMTKVTAAVTRERAKAGEKGVVAAPPAEAPAAAGQAASATPEAAKAPDAPAAAPAQAADSAAQRLDAIEAVIRESAASYSGGTHAALKQAIAEQGGKANEVLDRIAAKMDSMKEELKAAGGDAKLDPAEKIAAAEKILNDAVAELPELESVLGSIDPKKVTSSQGIQKAKARIEALGKDAMAFTYAKTLGDILPDPLNAVDFDVVLRALPGIPTEDATFISDAYRKMVGNALAQRAADVGVARVRKEFGAAWDNYVAGSGGFQSYGGRTKVDVDVAEVIKANIHGLEDRNVKRGADGSVVSSDATRLAAIIREYKKELEATGIPMDSQFARESLMTRAATARFDLISGRFDAENAGDLAKLEKLRSLRMRDRGEGKWIERRHNWDGSSSIIGNPIVDRMEGRIVSGRTQPRDMDGTTGLGKVQGAFSDGISEYMGFLWANPRRVWSAARSARRAIYGAAVENATWGRYSMSIGGEKVSGAMKEVKGLQAETIQQRMDQQRFLNIADAQERRANGTLSEEAYKARIDEIGSISGRNVEIHEQHVAQRFLDARERIDAAMAVQRKEVDEILKEAKVQGVAPVNRLLTVIDSVQAAVTKNKTDMVRAMQDYEVKAKKAAGGKSLERKAADGKTKVGEGSEAGSPAPGWAIGLENKGGIVSVARSAARDIDPVVIEIGGVKREVIPSEAITMGDVVVDVKNPEAKPRGDVKLFGDKIGTWTVYESEGAEVIRFTLDGLPEMDVRDLTSVLKRASFRKQFADKFAASASNTVKAADAGLPEGTSIPKEVSKTAEARSAQAELGADGKASASDLDKTLAQFDVPEGRTLAFKRKADGKILKAGLTGEASLRSALDRMGVTADEVEVGTLPSGRLKKSGETGKTTQEWASVNFVPLGRSTGTPDPSVARKLAADADAAPTVLKARRQPISMADAAKIDLGDGRSLAKVVEDFDLLSASLRWDQIGTLEQYNALMVKMQEHAELIESVAPHGIKRENASRRRSFHHLQQLMAGFSDQERSAALDMLRRIDPDRGGMPYFVEKDGSGGMFSLGYGENAGESKIAIGKDRATGMPMHFVVAHEVGHWAFVNMLSPTERMQFLKSLGKHFSDDGTIDVERVVGSLTHARDIERMTGATISDLRANTNEVFAWQFTDWVMSRTVGEARFAEEQSLWQKLLTYGRELISYFKTGKVDPDLVPLFERILPSKISDSKYRYDALYDRSLGTLRELKDITEDNRRAVTSLTSIMENIEGLRGKLAQHLFTPGGLGDVGMLEDLKAATNHMFGLLYGKQTSKNLDGLRAKLNPFRPATSAEAKAAGLKDEWLRDSKGKVMKDAEGNGLKVSRPLEGAIDPRELFSRNETGKLIQAIRDAAPEGLDDVARGNIAFEAAVDSEQFMAVMKATSIGDNPEVSAVFNQALEQEFKRQLAAGKNEVDALDAADTFALKEAETYAREELRLDIGESFIDEAGNLKIGSEAERQALGQVGRKLFDLMSDSLDHLNTEVNRFGFALRRADNGLVQEAKTAAEEQLEQQIEKEVKKASRSRKGAGRKTQPPSTEKSAEVVRGEEQARALDGNDKGVPAGASPLVKSLISRVSHRDKDQQDIIGTLLYRLLSHVIGPENLDRVSNADISKMAGVALESGFSPEAEAHQGTAAFDALRKGLRLASEDLTNGNRNALNAADFVIDVLSRAKAESIADDLGLELGTDITAEKIAAVVKDMARGKKVEVDDLIGSAHEIASSAADIISGLATSAAGKRAVGEATVATPGRVVPTTFSDGSYHPRTARADVTSRLSTLGSSVIRSLLESIGVAPSDNMAAQISRNIAFTQTGSASKRKLFVSLDDAVEHPMSPEATKAAEAIDAELASARARGDVEAAERLMTQREAVIRTQTPTGTLGVTPVLVNTDKVFDPMAVTKSQGAAILDAATRALAGDGNVEGLQRVAALLSAGDGVGAVDALKSLGGGTRFVNEVLKEAGFIGHTDGTAITLLKGSPKSLDEELAKIAKGRRLDSDSTDPPLSGEIALFYALDPTASPDTLAVEQRAILAGAPEPVAKLVGKLFRRNRGEGLSEQDAGTVRKFHGVQLMENSARLARAGASWLADKVKPAEGTGFYEALYSKMAGDLVPVIDQLDELGKHSGFLANNLDKFIRNASVWRSAVPQSEAEERIVAAMRRGDLAGLPREEAKVAVALQNHFRSLLVKQNDAGLPVGDITSGSNPFYLPQRFNLEWIRANTDEAVEKLGKWMAKDSGDALSVATGRARQVIFEALNREDLKGLLDGASTVYTQAFGDKLYSRTLNITGKDWDSMAPMFDSNLRSLVISYTEAAHKRMEWTNRFGVKGHAANTYVDIAERGSNAAMDALMGSVQEIPVVKPGRASSPDSLAGSVEFASKLFDPLARDEGEAAEIVARLVGILDRDGKSDATRNGLVAYLESMYASRGGRGVEQFRKRAEAIVNGLADFGDVGSTVAAKEREFMLKMVGVLGGRPAYTIDANQGLRSAASAVKVFNSVTLLATAAISSLSDPALVLARSGSLSAWMKGMGKGVKAAISDPATAAALRRVGVGIESIIHENLSHVSGGVSGRITNAFFLANGLTMWTDTMRKFSALTGFEAIKANQAIVQRERLAGSTDTWAYRRSMRFLRQLGVAHLADELPLGAFADSVNDLKVAEAVHRFANESIFQPNRNDMPLWTQDPIAGLIWQFKAYPTMMGRLVKRSFKEAVATEDGKYAGNPWGLLSLAAIGVGLGAGVSAVKDVVSGRNEEADPENPGDSWRSVRKRSLNKMVQELGFKDAELTSGMADELLGWYVEGVLQIGALGFIGDFFYQAARFVDNGSFGRERIMSQIAGPTYGTFSDMLQIVEGAHQAATSEEGDPNGKARAAVRKVLGRVPLVGSQRPMIEAWVNDIAGELNGDRRTPQ